MAVGHYENFPVASLLLPASLRGPVEIIYRFARSADDFADEGDDPPELRLQKLNDYRAQLAAPATPLFRDVEKIIREHGLPVQLFEDLLDAFSQDVTQKRYANYSQVLDYCRASMGFASKEQFRILFLDKRNQIIADEVQQTGTVDHTPVYVREVAKRALEPSATAIGCTIIRPATPRRRAPTSR